MKTKDPLLVTLNPGRMPHSDKIYDQHDFSHPVFDEGAVGMQDKIETIQGYHGFYFCGAYQRYGFHEDGLLSAVNIVRLMGHDIPWDPS